MWLEALGLLAGGLLGATIFLAVDFFLSEDKLVEEVEEQYPDAFKLLTQVSDLDFKPFEHTL